PEPAAPAAAPSWPESPVEVATAADGGPRKRWLLPAVAAVVLVALAGGVFALTRGGDGGGDGDGFQSVVGTISVPDNVVVARFVSVPANSVLIVRAEPALDAPDLDLMIGVLGFDDHADALVDFAEEAEAADSAVLDDFDETFGRSGFDFDFDHGDTIFLLEETTLGQAGVNGPIVDLSPTVLDLSDDRGAGGVERIVIPVREADEFEVAFFGFGDTEGDLIAGIHIVELEGEINDAEDFLAAMVETEAVVNLTLPIEETDDGEGETEGGAEEEASTEENPLLAFDDYTDEARAEWLNICGDAIGQGLVPAEQLEGVCECIFTDSQDNGVPYTDFAASSTEDMTPEVQDVVNGCVLSLVGDG
ncbi:MAG: hypothetical protein ACRD0G_19380, partial [Acidimicrobiales bacterium]